MTEITREIHLLVAIAKLDAQLNSCRKEIALLPDEIDATQRSIDKIEKAMTEAEAHLDDMSKERRSIEKTLDDRNEKIKTLKNQLMSVKTNKEYTAMLKEIGHIEKEIDEKEERLLILMDELDQQSTQNEDFTRTNQEKKQKLATEKSELESRLAERKVESAKLKAEKPKVLLELDPQLKKRYDRILAKMGDFAVTHVDDEICQGCFSRVPPQVALEVKNNDKIITCQACGRILVHYNA